MARVIPVSNAFPCVLHPTVRNCHRHSQVSPSHATTDDEGETAKSSDEATSSSADPDFERRIAALTSLYGSGKGKKAEMRRLKKAGIPASYLKNMKAPVMLPPVPLQDPTSAVGVPVKVGFSPYSERLNGYLATLGLAALLLVELGSGQSVVKYHTAGVVFLQIYTAAAVAALYVKYEKEKISVWPKSRKAGSAAATTTEK